MSSWKQIFIGVVLGFLLSGVVLLVGQMPRGTPIKLTTQTPRNIVVHVSGAVKSPGIVSLPWASRVADAVLAAGNFTEDAIPDAINLAFLLSDGEKVVVPSTLSTSFLLSTTPVSKNSPAITSTQSAAIFPININQAVAQDIERLPGIGPTKALAILLYRQEHGPFKKTEDLMQVPGIGQVTFDQIKNLITIGN